MTKEDIDKLLAGRKVVDAYRSVAAEYREVDSLSKVTLTTASIATAKEKYLDRETAIKKMHEELFKLGFGKAADTSAYGEFYKFNQAMITEEYTAAVDITYLGCKGCPTRKCVTLYGTGACGNQTGLSVTDNMRQFFIELRQKSADGQTKNYEDVKVCPDGYGFQWTRKRDDQFDLGWK